MDESTAPSVAADRPINSVGSLLAEAERMSQELARLADEMVARSEEGRRDARRLIAELGEAAAALSGDPEPDPAPAPAGPVGSDGARMLARQMFANGRSREDVERDLRTGFGIEDAAAVVESILADRR